MSQSYANPHANACRSGIYKAKLLVSASVSHVLARQSDLICTAPLALTRQDLLPHPNSSEPGPMQEGDANHPSLTQPCQWLTMGAPWRRVTDEEVPAM